MDCCETVGRTSVQILDTTLCEPPVADDYETAETQLSVVTSVSTHNF